MNRLKRFLSLALVAVFAASMMQTVSFADEAAPAPSVSASHYNIELVIDGSGSLTMKNGTDVKGYRYDALQLFLGLMTNSGNNVGAIVFDDSDPMPLNTKLRPISGSVAKTELADEIKYTEAGGDTDIGSALLEAVEKLEKAQKENGLPSVVVLMSDGITDLPNASQAALESSLEKEEKAIKEAKKNGIPVYSVLLNGNNGDSTGELEHISKETGGDYQEVKTSADLSNIYTLFYSLIYDADNTFNADAGENKFTFDENGIVVIEQDVPYFGVEEMNLIANSQEGITSITATTPSNTVLGEDQFEDQILKSDYYEFIKIEKPEGGKWSFTIQGHPKSDVMVDLIYNSNISLKVKNTVDSFSYQSGQDLQFEAVVYDGKKAVTESAAYNKDFVYGYLVSTENADEKYPLVVSCDGTKYELTYKLHEVETASTYVVQTFFSTTGIRAAGNAIIIDVNPAEKPAVNHQPKAVNGTISHDISAAKGETDTLALDTLFVDEDGDELTYSIASTDYRSDDVWVDGHTLKMNTSILTGRCTVRAFDGQASAMVNIDFLGNSAPQTAQDSIDIQIETNKLFADKTFTFSFADWFTDEDGDELEFYVSDCDYGYDQDGTITMNPADCTFTVVTNGFKKSNLILHAKDPKGASSEITVHFKVLNWWLIYGGIVTTILVIAGIALAVTIAAILHRRFKGYIRVENVRANSFAGFGSGGFRTTHPSQRKKLYLNSLPGISVGEFSGKCTIVPLSPSKIRFKSPTPVYWNGKATKSVDISMDSSETVYASEDVNAIGLCISAENPKGFSDGFGDFTADLHQNGGTTGGTGGFTW